LPKRTGKSGLLWEDKGAGLGKRTSKGFGKGLLDSFPPFPIVFLFPFIHMGRTERAFGQQWPTFACNGSEWTQERERSARQEEAKTLESLGLSLRPRRRLLEEKTPLLVFCPARFFWPDAEDPDLKGLIP
jgi:hypothetical protein